MHRSFAMMPPQIISYKDEAVPLRVGALSLKSPTPSTCGPLFQHHHELFHLNVERMCEQSQKTHRMLTGAHHSKSCSPAQHTRTLFFVAGGRTLMCTDKWTEWSNGRLLFPHFMGLWVYHPMPPALREEPLTVLVRCTHTEQTDLSL